MAVLMVLLFLSVGQAFAAAPSLSNEIQVLNQEFGHVKEYPILIVDKPDLNAYIKSLNLSKTVTQGQQERELTQAIMVYIYQRFNYKMAPREAADLMTYATEVVHGASAMPLFVDTVRYKVKACLVLPTEPEADHLKEVERLIGAADQPQLYKNFDVQKSATLMTSEQIQLFSLYHELSHCLDDKFLPEMYTAETDPWAVHRAEAFAEINGLLLLSQRKAMNDLGYPRSLLRTTYTKYLGTFVMNSAPSPFANPVVRYAGVSYFVTIPLMKAQELITADPGKIKGMSLAEILSLSQQLIEQYGQTKFGNDALRFYLTDGAEATLSRYQALAGKNAHMFQKAYEELIEMDGWLKSVEERIAKFPKSAFGKTAATDGE